MTGRAVRVLIVDDHPMVAEGIAALLHLEADIAVVGVVSTIDDAEAAIGRERPDVIVCDIRIGDDSGFSLLERHPERPPAFVMFSSYDQVSYHRAAFEGGAAGYVLKDGSGAELLAAVRTAARGGTSFSASTFQSVRRAVDTPSGRELQILELVMDGRSNDEIAHDLGIRPKTVESHLRTLFDRYDVLSRTELALRAMDEGWIRRHAHRSAAQRPGRPAVQDGWVVDVATLGKLKRRPGRRSI